MELEFESQRPLVRAMPHVEMVGLGVARNQDLPSKSIDELANGDRLSLQRGIESLSSIELL